MPPAVHAWRHLQLAADQARTAAMHERAIALYSEALAQPGIAWADRAALEQGRADCRYMLGQAATMDAELSAAADAARSAGEDAALVTILVELAFNLRAYGALARCAALAQEANEAATHTAQADLRVAACFIQGFIQVDMGDMAGAYASLDAAAAIHTPTSDFQSVHLLALRGYLQVRVGEFGAAVHSGEEALRLARANAWARWELISLNLLCVAEPDLARRGLLLEQMLELSLKLNDRPDQCVALANLSIWYLLFGMYERAAALAGQASEMAGDMQMHAVYIQQVLADACCALNQPAAALAHSEDGLALARWLDAPLLETVFLAIKSIALLYLDQPGAAVAQALAGLQRVPPGATGYAGQLLALGALASRLAGDLDAARSMVADVLSLLQAQELGHPEWTIEVHYWYCYCALAPAGVPPGAPGEPADKLWQVLNRGCKALLAPAAVLSDAGLRRSYLHRVWPHRLLIYEWLRWAPQHARQGEIEDFVAQVQRPGRLDEIFQRLLNVGIRLNRQRDSSRLASQIVDEAAELTGAERIALVLVEPDGQRRMAKVILPEPAPPFMRHLDLPSPAPEAFAAEIEPWLAEAANRQEPLLHHVAEGPLTAQRSILVTPLIDRGRLLGLIYCDLFACFGRFDAKDMELLGVLANQSAVALENAAASSQLASPPSATSCAPL